MAGRRSMRFLNICPKLQEVIVGDIKPRPPTAGSPLVTLKAFHNDIRGRRTLLAPLSKQRLPGQAIQTSTARRGFASQAENEVKKTPLYDLHVSKKAKFVPFGGYSMPLYYDDLSHAESHHWTREKASVFDVSHMYGEAPLSRLTFQLISSLGFSTSYRGLQQ